MFTDLLASILTSYKLSLSPKDLIRIKMDKDQEEEMQKYWHQYLENEFTSEDFFSDTPEELMEKQQAFANPFCENCTVETYSLIRDGDNKVFSMCPKCRRTYTIHI